MLATYGICVEPICATSADDDFSVGSPFYNLLRNPHANRLYLVEAQPWDIGAAATVWERLSDQPYITTPTDSPANTLYLARLTTPYDVERSIQLHDVFEPQSIPAAGDVELANGDGQLDSLLALSWDGRDISVKLGSPGWALADFGTVLKGKVDAISASTESIILAIQDMAMQLDKPIQANMYAGTGGLEGGSDLDGKPKPLLYGEVTNIEPILVDAANLIYQIHDGQIEAVTACYVNGDPLTFTSGTPTAGQYTTDLTAGTITLGGTPAGTVTADAKGSKTGGTYVSTAGTVLRRIVVDQGGFTDPTDLDVSTFDELEIRAPYTVGIYLDEPTNILDILDDLVTSIGGFWGMRRSGLIHVGILRPPGAAARSFDQTTIEKIERTASLAPAYRMRVGAQRVWHVHNENEIAGSVGATRRELISQEYRDVEAIDNTIKTDHARARDVQRIDTLLSNTADGQLVVDRLFALHSVARSQYDVTLTGQPFDLDVGDSVSITYSRWDLTAGKLFRIISISESATKGSTLGLWG